MSDEIPQIQIDDDWKAEAQREKERLAEKAASSAPAGGGSPAAATSPASPGAPGEAAAGPRELPPANFDTLVNTLASQALLYLGAMPDAQGRAYVSLEMARHQIDLLGVLEEKTKDSVTDDEKRALASTLYELRNAYVSVAQAVREQALQGGSPGAAAGGPGAPMS